jgi:hypothetical protein
MIQKVKSRVQGYIQTGRANAQRYLDARPHRTLRPTPKHRYKKGKKVDSLWALVKGTFVTIWQERRILLALMLLCALIMYVFVGGIPTLSFADLRKTVGEVFMGNIGEFGSAASLFFAAITGSLNQATSQLQQFLAGLITVIFWLTYVWTLRRLLADEPKPVKIRDALYNSGTPIVPTAMIMLTAVVQLLPGALGLFGAVLVINGIWLQGGVETMLICVAGLLLVLLSIYWVVSSFMALVIVTLPGMYPWRALAGASVLVIGQRWAIAMRIITVAIIIFAVWAIVLIPLLLLDNWLKFNWLPLIPFAVQILSAFTVLYATVFVYRMYRSMI